MTIKKIEGLLHSRAEPSLEIDKNQYCFYLNGRMVLQIVTKEPRKYVLDCFYYICEAFDMSHYLEFSSTKEAMEYFAK